MHVAESPSDISQLVSYLATLCMQSFTPLQAHPPLFLVVSLTTFLPLPASFGLQNERSIRSELENFARLLIFLDLSHFEIDSVEENCSSANCGSLRCSVPLRCQPLK